MTFSSNFSFSFLFSYPSACPIDLRSSSYFSSLLFFIFFSLLLVSKLRTYNQKKTVFAQLLLFGLSHSKTINYDRAFRKQLFLVVKTNNHHTEIPKRSADISDKAKTNKNTPRQLKYVLLNTFPLHFSQKISLHPEKSWIHPITPPTQFFLKTSKTTPT